MTTKTKEINWTPNSPDEVRIIGKIVARAMKLYPDAGIDAMTMNMDITATHLNGCPLDLVDLLDAPDFDFLHDVLGIRRHIDRTTGQLADCFLPRTAAHGICDACQQHRKYVKPVGDSGATSLCPACLKQAQAEVASLLTKVRGRKVNRGAK